MRFPVNNSGTFADGRCLQLMMTFIDGRCLQSTMTFTDSAGNESTFYCFHDVMEPTTPVTTDLIYIHGRACQRNQ